MRATRGPSAARGCRSSASCQCARPSSCLRMRRRVRVSVRADGGVRACACGGRGGGRACVMGPPRGGSIRAGKAALGGFAGTSPQVHHLRAAAEAQRAPEDLRRGVDVHARVVVREARLLGRKQGRRADSVGLRSRSDKRVERQLSLAARGTRPPDILARAANVPHGRVFCCRTCVARKTACPVPCVAHPEHGGEGAAVQRPCPSLGLARRREPHPARSHLHRSRRSVF